MARKRKPLDAVGEAPLVARLLRSEPAGLRRERLLAVQLGFDAVNDLDHVANAVGHARSTIQKWFDAYRLGGVEALRVNMKLKRLTGERPSTVLAWHRIAEGNCVAVRRGGKQPEANLSSQSSQTRRLNPIRPFGMASLRRKGEALALSLPEAITKHDHTIAKDSEGGWDEKAGKAEQLSVEILPGATESGEEVRALIVALKRVTTVEPRGVGR